MATGSRQKTTMAKLNRERALRERRELKQARKAARRLEAAHARLRGPEAEPEPEPEPEPEDQPQA